jgi:retinoid hydroxylase
MNSRQELPPGEFGFPLVGESLEWLLDPGFFKKRHQKYGNVFKTSLFGVPTVAFIGFEANRFLFENEGNYFSDGMCPAVPKSTQELMGQGALVLQAGEEHKKNRKIIYQSLQSKAIEEYIQIINTQTINYLGKWAIKREFKWHNELKKYSLSIATESFLGIDIVNSNKKFSNLYTTWGDGLLSFPINLPFTKFGKALKSRYLLLDKIGEIVKSRDKNDPGKDLLGKLLDHCNKENSILDINDIPEQLLTLLFAGHDTLASALTSFCQLIANNQKIKQKLYEEQNTFQDVEILTISEIKKMTYLEKVVKEVLRFAPPTGGPPRRVLKDCNYKGYKIPKGWNILYNIGQTQQDNLVYSCPYEFNPENINQITKKPAFSYIPFGAGSRECVGKDFAILELKIFAIHLIRGYEWNIKQNQSFRKILLPALHPRDGLKVIFCKKE